jgi:hypothetical protein
LGSTLVRAMRDNDTLRSRIGRLLLAADGQRLTQMQAILTPSQAWRRLAHMRTMVVRQPELARLVDRMSLYDQLELTLELLHDKTWHDEDTWYGEELAVPAPSNIVRFRRRRTR